MLEIQHSNSLPEEICTYSSDTCWVAEMVCYHDMTDWVSARTILK